MTALLKMVADFLESEGFNFDLDKENSLVRFGVSGRNGPYSMLIDVLPEHRLIKCFSIVPVRAPENKRETMIEFLTRANYGLPFGNFELDLSDGEVRFKTSMHTDEGAVGPAVLRRLVFINANFADEYLPGIVRIVDTDVSAEEAVRDIEQDGGEGGMAPPSDD
jgi:hypothetical protein